MSLIICEKCGYIEEDDNEELDVCNCVKHKPRNDLFPELVKLAKEIINGNNTQG